jgi:glutaminase
LGWLLKKNAGNSGGTFVMNPSKKTIQLGCVLLLIEGVYMAASRWAFWSMGYGIQSGVSGFLCAGRLNVS